MTNIARQSIQVTQGTNEAFTGNIEVIIDRYTCGEIVVGGKCFSSDLILYPNRIHTHWRREKEHQVCIEDIEDTFLAGNRKGFNVNITVKYEGETDSLYLTMDDTTYFAFLRTSV